MRDTAFPLLTVLNITQPNYCVLCSNLVRDMRSFAKKTPESFGKRSFCWFSLSAQMEIPTEDRLRPQVEKGGKRALSTKDGALKTETFFHMRDGVFRRSQTERHSSRTSKKRYQNLADRRLTNCTQSKLPLLKSSCLINTAQIASSFAQVKSIILRGEE